MVRNRTGYLVGLTGYAGVGKDEAAKGLIAAGWTRLAFADPVRAMALAIDPLVVWPLFSPDPVRLSLIVAKRGWHTAKQAPEVRRLLQTIGTDGVRAHLGADAWVRAFDLARDRRADTVAPDVRFPNEADHIRRHGGLVIRIDRPGVGPVNGHASEDIDAVGADATVVNDLSVAELQWRVAELVDAHYGTTLNLPF